VGTNVKLHLTGPITIARVFRISADEMVMDDALFAEM
jgi:hypothetical protein